MNIKPTLVIVIPTRNRQGLLQKAIKSSLEQNYLPFRVEVINDGSTDNTQQYLDTLSDPRIHVTHMTSRCGVNAARNKALKSLRDGEWAIFLDDDDRLLEGALELVASSIAAAPVKCEVLFFNTLLETAHGEEVGGYKFSDGAEWHQVTYREFMTKTNRRGDSAVVISASIFQRGYSFSEDVNGFESEFFSRLARDAVPMYFKKGYIVRVNRIQDAGHLSKTAALENPDSFVRAHARMFREHKDFFARYPSESMRRAVGAFKNSVRAFDPLRAILFCFYWLQGFVRFVFGKGEINE